ncbi:MAG: efflux RND transporter periplasmic adaptor subunit [Bradyrhizobium sp.]
MHKDQVVAQLESGVDQAMLELAKAKAESDATVKARQARLVFLAKKRERTTGLQAKGAASDAALDEIESDFGVANQDLRDAEANMRIAQLDVIRAEEVLKLRSIKSPINGVVAERSLLGGEYAYEQAPIMTIAQIDPLNVEVFVPVGLYGTISVGTEATVIGEAPVGGRFTAKVEVIDPLIDARSGTFGIRLLLPNPNNKIPAGLRCKVEFPGAL